MIMRQSCDHPSASEVHMRPKDTNKVGRYETKPKQPKPSREGFLNSSTSCGDLDLGKKKWLR